ncbi:MAG: glyoxalase [Arthrobacter sp.]|nr:glyoxalase [Arthrobacter sp.]
MCSIHVKDPAAAHSFYTGTLGFETLMAMPEYNLYIIKDPGSQDPGPQNNGAAGIRFQGAPSEDPSGISAVFDDGCGNYVQLHQD